MEKPAKINPLLPYEGSEDVTDDVNTMETPIEEGHYHAGGDKPRLTRNFHKPSKLLSKYLGLDAPL
jgi:hypothetical protein